MMTYQGLKNAKINSSDGVILPIPFEKTVCGKKGTSQAPQAILRASMDIEYYEEEYYWSPFKFISLHTCKAPKEIHTFENLDLHVKKNIKKLNNQFLLSLGGEHSITPFITKYLLPKKSTIVFFDAHADFRKSYQGSKNNHACALYNLVNQGHEAIVIGVRSFFEDEKQRMEKRGIKYFTDFSLQEKRMRKQLIKLLKKTKGNVYISVDMDCFSPAFVSGVGTPMPGGIDWFFFLKSLKTLFFNKKINVIGADIVELIPEKSKVSQIISAKIIQKIFSYWGQSKKFHLKKQNGSQARMDYE